MLCGSNVPFHRPRGLKRSAPSASPAGKAVKGDAEAAAVHDEDAGLDDEDAAQVAFEGHEDMDDYEQADAILSAALGHLGRSFSFLCLFFSFSVCLFVSDEGDLDQARMLLQGAVHECDRLIAAFPEEANGRPDIFRCAACALV